LTIVIFCAIRIIVHFTLGIRGATMPVLAAIVFFSLFFVASVGPIFLGRELGASEFFLYTVSLSAALASILFLVLHAATRKGLPFLIVSVGIFLFSGLFGFVASLETGDVDTEYAKKMEIQMMADRIRLNPYVH